MINKHYDYGRWMWFIYQALVAILIEANVKWDFRLTLNSRVPEDYKNFRHNFLRFKRIILHRNYYKSKRIYSYGAINKTRDKELDILLEWDGDCFEDINLLKISQKTSHDLYVFIQVKAKTENAWDMSPQDGILKAINNFYKNIHFQKYKFNGNVLFFIVVNKDISKAIENIVKKEWKSYITIANDIIAKNNEKKKTANGDLPTKQFSSLDKKWNKDFIVNILNNGSIPNLFGPENDKMVQLVQDIDVILSNLHIIHNIKMDVLEKELERYYRDNLWNKAYEVLKKSCDVTSISSSNSEYEKYKKYQYTFFDSKDGWKTAAQLDAISKWKFM